MTASTGAGLSAVWVIGIILLWGATLGWAYQQVLVIAGTVTKPAAENVKRKWRAAFPFGIIAIPAAAIPL